MSVILASSSPIRREMLRSAGVLHESMSPNVDEEALKARLGSSASLASHLAAAKATSVDRDGWIIGSDSIVLVDGQLFSKPGDRHEAADHLRFFSGKTMQLTSAVALARRGQVDWCHADTACLSVRPLSDSFIEAYLDAEWPEVGYTVGVFRLEGLGVQIFSAIHGDFFTVLGMPLLPLLSALRQRQILMS